MHRSGLYTLISILPLFMALPLLPSLEGSNSKDSTSPTCKGDSLISALNCNVADLGLDLDIAPDVDVLKRGERPKEMGNHGPDGEGGAAEPTCEGDSLISALNCNVLDVDDAVDVLPDIGILKERGELWSDTTGEDEDKGDAPTCEGDSLVSLLNCNVVGLEMGPNLSPEANVGDSDE